MTEFMDEESYSEYLAIGEFEPYEIATEELIDAIAYS
jgi:hypothetical protein